MQAIVAQQQQQGSEASTADHTTASFLSNLPEVSGLTIAVVASGCGVLIVCLLLVLVFFCCRSRSAKSSSDSDQFSHRDASSVERKVISYMQYDGGCDQRHHQHHQQQHQPQQQQYAMVSPHPSLTSTDETSVDQGSSKVFATLVSGNNPVTAAAARTSTNDLLHTSEHPAPPAADNEGSESDHSGSLLQPSRQTHQRKIIYEVVV